MKVEREEGKKSRKKQRKKSNERMTEKILKTLKTGTEIKYPFLSLFFDFLSLSLTSFAIKTFSLTF